MYYWRRWSFPSKLSLIKGVSPDDIEILNACKDQGFEYIRSDSNNKRTFKVRNQFHQFEVLKLLEFNSDRKRMSIIVKDEEMIKLYIKGADTELIRRLSDNSKVNYEFL